jgi:hypothetical protein
MSSLWGWVCLVVLVMIGFAGGVATFGWLTEIQRRTLGDRERALRDEWEGLRRAQELNEAFWRARTTMRDSAARAMSQYDVPESEWPTYDSTNGGERS